MTHSGKANFSTHGEEECPIFRALVIREAIYRRREATARSERAVSSRRVDRDFAGFSFSFTSPGTYTRCAPMRAFRRLRVHCLVFGSRSDTPPPPPPTAITRPGRPRKRLSERVRDPMPAYAPCSVSLSSNPRPRCLSLALCLAYIRRRNRLRFS